MQTTFFILSSLFIEVTLHSRWIFNFPLPIISIHFAQNWNSLIPFQKPKIITSPWSIPSLPFLNDHFPPLLLFPRRSPSPPLVSPILNPFLELPWPVRATPSIQFHYCHTVLRFHPRALRNSCELLSGTNYPRAVGMR